MNSYYKKIRILLSEITGSNNIDKIIVDAFERKGVQVSKSKLQGWRVSVDHKNYRKMMEDDLSDVLNALIDYYKK